MKYYESSLLQEECTAITAQFLIRLPEDLSTDQLFRVITTVHTTAHKKSFADIFNSHVDSIETESLNCSSPS